MIYYLRKARKESRVKKTVTLLGRLLQLTVQTGFISAAVAVLCLVLFLASPGTRWYEIPGFTAGKVYSNALLAVRTGVQILY